MGFLSKVAPSLGKTIESSFKYVWSNGIYLYGHPSVSGTNISVTIFLMENEMTVYKQSITHPGMHDENILFKLPYEKIASSDIIDLAKFEKTYAAQTGSFPLDNIFKVKVKGMKGDTLAVVAMGKDKNGNQVHIPIVFKKVTKCMELKPKLDEMVSKAQGVTI